MLSKLSDLGWIFKLSGSLTDIYSKDVFELSNDFLLYFQQNNTHLFRTHYPRLRQIIEGDAHIFFRSMKLGEVKV